MPSFVGTTTTFHDGVAAAHHVCGGGLFLVSVFSIFAGLSGMVRIDAQPVGPAIVHGGSFVYSDSVCQLVGCCVASFCVRLLLGGMRAVVPGLL